MAGRHAPGTSAAGPVRPPRSPVVRDRERQVRAAPWWGALPARSTSWPIWCSGRVWSCTMRQRPRRACCQSFTQCHSCNKCNSPVILPCARETRKRLADQARLRAYRPGWRERYAAGGIRALDDARHCPPGLAEGSPRLAPLPQSSGCRYAARRRRRRWQGRNEAQGRGSRGARPRAHQSVVLPGDHADAGGRARPRAGDRGLRSAGSEDAFEAVRRGGTISLRLVAG